MGEDKESNVNEFEKVRLEGQGWRGLGGSRQEGNVDVAVSGQQNPRLEAGKPVEAVDGKGGYTQSRRKYGLKAEEVCGQELKVLGSLRQQFVFQMVAQ